MYLPEVISRESEFIVKNVKIKQSNIVYFILLIFWSIVGFLYLITLFSTCHSLDMFFNLSGCKLVSDKQGNKVSYSDSGGFFYMLSDDVVEIWDSRQVSLINQISQNGVLRASISSDEKTLLSDNGNEIILWDLSSGQPFTHFSGEEIAGSVFIQDNTIIQNNLVNEATEMWNWQSEEIILEIPHFQFSVVSLNKQVIAGKRETNFEVWNIESNILERVIEFEDHFPYHLALSSDGGYLSYLTEKMDVNGSKFNEIILVDVESGDTLTSLSAPSESISTISFNPTNTILAAGSVDGAVYFWDLENNYQLRSLKFNNKERVFDIAFSPINDDVLVGTDRFTAIFSLSDILD